MNKLAIVTVGILLQAITTSVYAVPVERGAIIGSTLEGKPKTLDILANLIRGSGYTCDSINIARAMTFTRGFTVSCNKGVYSYDIEDKGGNWVVTLD